MQIKTVMLMVHEALNAAGATHALIGGMALSALGNPRATNDVYFLVHSDFRFEIEREMLSRGFELFHSSAEVAQWTGMVPVDFLYANREITKEMLKRANSTINEIKLSGITVLDASDIIGLKIQAYCNNPKRLFQDLADIQKLIEVNEIDWKRVKIYAEAFNEWQRIESFKTTK
ncbi:MAG: hypothetical protein NT027_09855 [Proteobacteria bacterium]|nr:hypothetical protein [Pseudomonadota bacterium]